MITPSSGGSSPCESPVIAMLPSTPWERRHASTWGCGSGTCSLAMSRDLAGARAISRMSAFDALRSTWTVSVRSSAVTGSTQYVQLVPLRCAGRSDRQAATMQKGKEDAEQKRASPRPASGTQSRELRRSTEHSDEGHMDAVRRLCRSRAVSSSRTHPGRAGQGRGFGQEARRHSWGARDVKPRRHGRRDAEAVRPRRIQERRGSGQRSLSTHQSHLPPVERVHVARTDGHCRVRQREAARSSSMAAVQARPVHVVAGTEDIR